MVYLHGVGTCPTLCFFPYMYTHSHHAAQVLQGSFRGERVNVGQTTPRRIARAHAHCQDLTAQENRPEKGRWPLNIGEVL